MKWTLLTVLCVLASDPGAAVVDPLNSQFLPSMDQNAAHYSVALGTITMTDSLYKVMQSSVAPGTARWLTVYAMQNEMQSFQVHVTPSVGVTSLTVTMSNLTNAQTGTVISSNTTDVVVYREFYLNITTPTCLSTTTYVGGKTGFMPDILIPAKDPYWGQTTNAFPVSVSANKTQSAWIDVHVPSSAPSGYYSGTVTVSSGAVVISTMPVTLAVWSWVMPSTASLPMIGSGFGYNGMCDVSYGGTATCGNYPNSGGGADGANTQQWVDGSRQMLDNRWTIDSPSNIFPNTDSFANYIAHIGPLINGTSEFTATILPGAALTKIQVNFSSANITGDIWQNWATNFNAQGWFPRTFYYPCDEPGDAPTWALCVSTMVATRKYSTPIIPNQVTADMADAITNGATNYIDWMTPIIENLDTTASGNLKSTYNTWLSTMSAGVQRYLGSYQDCESAGTCSNGSIGPADAAAYPNRHIDGTPVANRAFETWAYLEGISYQLYFAVDICDTPSGGCTDNSPWRSVYDFGGNGDGTLIYPSTGTYVAVSTPIWCPSMRLKHYRDGEQDFEYAYYLNQKGYDSFVRTQIGTWMTNGYTFSNDPAGLEAYRIALGNKIHQLTYPPSTGETFQGSVKIQGKVTIQ